MKAELEMVMRDAGFGMKYEQRDSGVADGFGFDVRHELTGFNQNGTLNADGTVSAAYNVSVTYDANGNRIEAYDGNHAPYATAPSNQYNPDLHQYPGYFSYATHGGEHDNNFGQALNPAYRSSGVTTPLKTVIASIRGNPIFQHKSGTLLLVCNSDADRSTFARSVAAGTGKPVLAPDKYLWLLNQKAHSLSWLVELGTCIQVSSR